MKNYFLKINKLTQKNQKGYAILFTIVVVSAISVITAGLTNAAYKQLILSSLAKDSQAAFYQSDTAGDCALYADRKNPSGIITTGGSWTCGGADLNVTPLSGGSYTIYPVDEDILTPCFRIDVTKTTNVEAPPTPSWETGLISWWNLDSDATDSIGGHDGTVTGAVLTSIGCKSGQCYTFAGSGDKIDVGVIPIPGDQGSISVWVQASSVGTYRCAIGRFWSQHYIGTQSSTDLSGRWQTSDGWGGVSSNVGLDTNLHHIVLTYDGSLGSGNVKIYVDGTLNNYSNFTGDTGNNTQPWQIGAHGNGEQFWKGTIDEVMMWGRPLDSTEVQELYNSLGGSTGTTTVQTQISAKGYNICKVDNLRTVEREIEINYEEEI